MKILSGIQPSSNSLHLGNYIGSILNWKKVIKNMSANDECLFMIADLHALTSNKNAEFGMLNDDISDSAKVMRNGAKRYKLAHSAFCINLMLSLDFHREWRECPLYQRRQTTSTVC